MNLHAEPPAREVEELLGRAAALMQPEAGSMLEAELRACLGTAYSSTLAKGRYEAVLAMLAEPAVVKRLDEICAMRRRMAQSNAERRRRNRRLGHDE